MDYDEIGRTYRHQRRADPRIEAQIHRAIGDAESVLNVGAGTGSYEPPQTVLAVEPSVAMIAQRPPGLAPVLRASATDLPLDDDMVDVALAVLTVHHWPDAAAGLRELRRVARQRVVVLTWTPDDPFWLFADYLPALLARDRERFPLDATYRDALGPLRVETVPVPHDCVDGFLAAYWRRPDAYLDPNVRAGMSCFAESWADAWRPGIARLRDELACGQWHAKHGHLLERDAIDAGYRLLVTR